MEVTRRCRLLHVCVDRDVLMRGLRVQSCVSGHIRGGREGVTKDAGFRQAGQRSPPIGKALPNGYTGWGSDG